MQLQNQLKFSDHQVIHSLGVKMHGFSAFNIFQWQLKEHVRTKYYREEKEVKKQKLGLIILDDHECQCQIECQSIQAILLKDR